MIEDFINKLEQRLKEPLPGEKAQMIMGSGVRMKELKFMPMDETTKKSGVMILLYPVNNSIFSVLILRPEYSGTHSGQVAFPGGKYEVSDGNLIKTALRETSEEIGIDTKKIKVLGQLSTLYIPPSNYIVYPTIGFINDVPLFIPDKNEVSAIIEYPISDLLNKGTVKRKTIKIKDDISFIAPYFDIKGYVVWGATAMMLSEFKELIKGIKIS